MALPSLKNLDFTSSAGFKTAWDTLTRVPAGNKIFSALLGQAAPYTGSIGAEVLEIRHGYAKVQLKDRRAVRNHLDSVHAIALMNLAEVASGVAMMYGIPADARGILSKLSIEYKKKARGTLIAECSPEIPATSERTEYALTVDIKDEAGDIVATAIATWLIGPRTK